MSLPAAMTTAHSSAMGWFMWALSLSNGLQFIVLAIKKLDAWLNVDKYNLASWIHSMKMTHIEKNAETNWPSTVSIQESCDPVTETI